MIPSTLKYEPIGNDESQFCGNLIYSILTDSEIMDTIHERHAAGVRCAVITVVEKGEVVDGYVADQEAILDLVPFVEVRDAVASYSLSDSICSVVIRDGRAAAGISGKL